MGKTLVCWIGTTDLRCSAGQEDGLGPIGQAASEFDFESIELLTDDHGAKAKKTETSLPVAVDYVKWLRTLTKSPINLHKVELSSPMHYGEIYERADEVVARLKKAGARGLVFHLSPGTSAMAAMWLVLATTKHDAELIASTKEKGVYTPEFPFEISADYLPRQRAAVRGKRLSQAFEERTPPAFSNIIHRCDSMKKVIARAQRLAEFDVNVMILGETGTGKELFAQAIHVASPRRSKGSIPVNCGAIPKELVESELFGHVKGAFTGATADRVGLIQQAHGGTLFLDEIGELSPDVQVKLLRVLQEKKLRRIGDDSEIAVEFRVICATHRDLLKSIGEKSFREDLYHRLAVGILQLPPLRNRREDLNLLIDFHLNHLTDRLRLNQKSVIPRLSPAARNSLKKHGWPGNIRELFNTLTRAVIWCESGTLEKEDIDSAIIRQGDGTSRDSILDQPIGEGFSITEVLHNVERHFIERALQETDTDKAAAKLLGYESDPAMKYRMRALGIPIQRRKKIL